MEKVGARRRLLTPEDEEEEEEEEGRLLWSTRFVISIRRRETELMDASRLDVCLCSSPSVWSDAQLLRSRQKVARVDRIASSKQHCLSVRCT